jgi:hypothetical protein
VSSGTSSSPFSSRRFRSAGSAPPASAAARGCVPQRLAQEVDGAALPGRAEHLPDRGLQPLMRVGDDEHAARRPPSAGKLLEAGPRDELAHVLPHAHASWLAGAGVPAAAAAARLGHADGGAFFLRVYAHAGSADGVARTGRSTVSVDVTQVERRVQREFRTRRVPSE